EPLADTPAIAAARRLGAAEILALVRLDPATPDRAAKAGRPWDDFLAVACRRRKSAWSADFLVHQADAAAQLRAVPISSDAPVRALSQGSLLAIVETRLSTPAAEDAGPLSTLFDQLGFPETMRAVLGSRQAVAVRAVGSPPGVAAALALDTTDAAAMTRGA